MKLLAFSDAHLQANTPKNRKDDYAASLRAKFDEITRYIEFYKIEAVLNGGDLFNRPQPATSIVNEYLKVFRSWNCPIYSIIGSHDKFGYNDETLPRTGLGTLVSAGLVTIVNETIWLDLDTQLAGVSHSYNLDDNPDNYFRPKLTMTFLPKPAYLIQLVHGMLVDKPFFGNHTLISDLKLDADLAICGHYHPGFGPITSGNTVFINVGSLGRVERVKRKFKPSVLLIDSVEHTIDLLPLSVAEDDDVFLQKEVNETVLDTNFDQFMTLLREKSIDFESGNVKQVVEIVGKENNFDANVVKRAVELVESCMTQ